MELTVQKIKRSYCVCAGESVLGKFRTEDAAKASAIRDPSFYAYWAGSAGSSVENSIPVSVLV